MFLRKLQANVSNHAVTLLLIDWYQYHPLLLFAVSDRKSRATHSAVRTYRIISSVSLLILRVLSHGQNICFYFADASALTSSDTASTWNEWKPSMSSSWVVCGNISTKLFNDSL